MEVQDDAGGLWADALDLGETALRLVGRHGVKKGKRVCPTGFLADGCKCSLNAGSLLVGEPCDADGVGQFVVVCGFNSREVAVCREQRLGGSACILVGDVL